MAVTTIIANNLAVGAFSALVTIAKADTVLAPAAGNTATMISYAFYIPSLSMACAVPVIAAASAAVLITVHIIAVAGTIALMIAAATAVSVIRFSAADSPAGESQALPALQSLSAPSPDVLFCIDIG